MVSKEFNENLKTGEYTKEYGIRYYNTKENKNIPISNINYSEIAFSLSMSKEKVFELIKHLIQYMSESITKQKFKNKTMPGLGVLILKQNIFAVKFDKDFENNIKLKNAKLNLLKSNISLERELNLNSDKDLYIGTCPNIYNTSESIKATNSLITDCKHDAKIYLRNNYNIGILNTNSFTLTPSNKLSESKGTNNYFYRNTFFGSKDHPFKFLNDGRRKILSLSKDKLLKSEKTPRSVQGGQNPLLNLDNMILKTLSYFKGSMIKDSKDLDVNKTGSISKEDAITMLMKNIPDITILKQICDDYKISFDSILNGKIEKQNSSSKNKLLIILGAIIIIFIAVIIIVINTNSFEFKTISTSCSNFNISGSIAYSKSNSHLYLSNINYCGGNDNNFYKKIECRLYENNGNTKILLEENIYEDNKLIKLETYLEKLSFTLSDFSKSCSGYNNDSLYLEINATKEDSQIINYQIPLSLNNACK